MCSSIYSFCETNGVSFTDELHGFRVQSHLRLYSKRYISSFTNSICRQTYHSGPRKEEEKPDGKGEKLSVYRSP